METRQPLFPQLIYDLLQDVKHNLTKPECLEEMSDKEVIAYIIDEILSVCDNLQTPIYRIDNEFIIYHLGTPKYLTKKQMEVFLLWCSRFIGLGEWEATNYEFRDKLFGMAWWKMMPEG
ncbi:MAG TPA: hypothetical protein VGG71_13510 [Chitinophagaceae bacterium]|jgi:hypothetical protein